MSNENQLDEGQRAGLGLTPNEVVGYRIMPDTYSWTVVLVKRHGKDSKHAGQEYKDPVSYHKNLSFAVQSIVNHVSAVEGKKLQDEAQEKTGVVASLDVLPEAFARAQQAALDAVADLEKRLKDAGYQFEGYRLQRDFLKRTTGSEGMDEEA